MLEVSGGKERGVHGGEAGGALRVLDEGGAAGRGSALDADAVGVVPGAVLSWARRAGLTGEVRVVLEDSGRVNCIVFSDTARRGKVKAPLRRGSPAWRAAA